MINKKIVAIISILFLILLTIGCAEFQMQSNSNSLIGTWESGIVDGAWIHHKTFYADGTFNWQWLYHDTRTTYSTTTGTWSADETYLTVVSDHTDRYTYQFIDYDTLQLTWEGGSRTYYRQ